MPEFYLNDNATKRCGAFNSLNEFERGYVEAMFFTNGDTGDEREDLLNELGTARLTVAAIGEIKNYCAAFRATKLAKPLDGCETIGDLLDGATAGASEYSEEQAGRDLWFKSQGHGVGFSDREQLTEQQADILSTAARKAGKKYVEVWRGWIYYR